MTLKTLLLVLSIRCDFIGVWTTNPSPLPPPPPPPTHTHTHHTAGHGGGISVSVQNRWGSYFLGGGWHLPYRKVSGCPISVYMMSCHVIVLAFISSVKEMSNIVHIQTMFHRKPIFSLSDTKCDRPEKVK